jgi:putative transposase
LSEERQLKQGYDGRIGPMRGRSLRIKGYDYTHAGAYFVTICAEDKSCLFGNVVDGCMCLNDAGHMLAKLWNDLPARFAGVEIDTLW